MAIKIILIVISFIYIAFNAFTAKMMTAREMKKEFIDGQCQVGRILANIFYLPAWLLKGIRFVVVAAIK